MCPRNTANLIGPVTPGYPEEDEMTPRRIQTATTVHQDSQGSSIFVLDSLSEPDANAILRLLGPWLFDATLNRNAEYSNGKAHAIRCLAHIICEKNGGNSKRILDPHVARFLQTVIRSLHEKESDRVVAAVLYSGYGIFGINGVCTFRGNGMLVGHFMHAIGRIYSKLM